MDFEFSSKEELYQRVSPALRAKVMELKRLGYPYIKEVDIWNYLIETKWCKGHDLMLSDIVNDILKTNNEKIDSYLKEKLNKDRTHYFDNNLEILWGEVTWKRKMLKRMLLLQLFQCFY